MEKIRIRFSRNKEKRNINTSLIKRRTKANNRLNILSEGALTKRSLGNETVKSSNTHENDGFQTLWSRKSRVNFIKVNSSTNVDDKFRQFSSRVMINSKGI